MRRVGGIGARARLDQVLVDRDRAGCDPWPARDHPLPAILDLLDVAVAEVQVRLVVHAVDALDDRFLYLVDPLGGLPVWRIDLQDRVVVDLGLEVLRPAAVTAQPRTPVVGVLQVAVGGVRLREGQGRSAKV